MYPNDKPGLGVDLDEKEAALDTLAGTFVTGKYRVAVKNIFWRIDIWNHAFTVKKTKNSKAS